MNQRTRIKICGIMTVDAALAAIDAGADAVGLVFAPNSPRRIDLDDAIEIVDALPPFVTPVGLFQLGKNASNADLDEWWCEWCQLHGDEDEKTVAKVAESHRIIRGFPFNAAQIKRWNDCDEVAALLIDGSKGGGGTSFDHAGLARMTPEIDKPIILAGGLTPENVGDAIRAVRPFAVDVSSGVESSRGVKDAALIHKFCAAVRAADAG
ncbi:MAG TPA: phosphoribosylanthranilate isomerase [Phycisphaerales bacterium]|nr:phosphoribosylanthranilate isomerase [Phycisphaerales bacterium]HRQ76466.1 phosphoribosylanthranilate isomerase [Phycisphaerales bacterium]